MKSTTLRRAGLSKEKMEVLEALAKYRRQVYDKEMTSAKYNAPTRPLKEKELDILWHNFRHNTKTSEKSPGVYLLTGFIVGAVSMLLMVALLMSARNMELKTVKSNNKIEEAKLTFIPADKTIETVAPTGTKEVYKVQSGDTLESIVIRFYGSYDKSKVQKIMDANHLKNPNAISIGQELEVPLN